MTLLGWMILSSSFLCNNFHLSPSTLSAFAHIPRIAYFFQGQNENFIAQWRKKGKNLRKLSFFCYPLCSVWIWFSTSFAQNSIFIPSININKRERKKTYSKNEKDIQCNRQLMVWQFFYWPFNNSSLSSFIYVYASFLSSSSMLLLLP